MSERCVQLIFSSGIFLNYMVLLFVTAANEQMTIKKNLTLLFLSHVKSL